MNAVCNVIGAGLAGCEAAWTLAQNGVQVRLFEMKPLFFSPAHKNPNFAELVCSNSLKAARIDSAAGLLKEEMRRLDSLLVPLAEENAVGAGGALAVDRDNFSRAVTEKIRAHGLVETVGENVSKIDINEFTIIATGPLTSDALSSEIQKLTGGLLSFYDAAAPIVTAESIDQTKTFFAARYDKGTPDYINCPFEKEDYLAFHEELINAKRAPLHEFEEVIENPNVYEGCMPIEILARRGADTLRFGPMKPVGLELPERLRQGFPSAYAVVQLRKENREGTLYNIVGFQTNLKFGEQKRVFSMISGLENAEFARYGVMHRNSFICSPKVLNADFSLKEYPKTFFAGQLTGVEGYMESAMSGILAARNVISKLKDEAPFLLPKTTMCGALAAYVTDEFIRPENFTPMGANMGLLPELDAAPVPPAKKIPKNEKYRLYAERALTTLYIAT